MSMRHVILAQVYKVLKNVSTELLGVETLDGFRSAVASCPHWRTNSGLGPGWTWALKQWVLFNTYGCIQDLTTHTVTLDLCVQGLCWDCHWVWSLTKALQLWQNLFIETMCVKNIKNETDLLKRFNSLQWVMPKMSLPKQSKESLLIVIQHLWQTCYWSTWSVCLGSNIQLQNKYLNPNSKC